MDCRAHVMQSKHEYCANNASQSRLSVVDLLCVNSQLSAIVCTLGNKDTCCVCLLNRPDWRRRRRHRRKPFMGMGD